MNTYLRKFLTEDLHVRHVGKNGKFGVVINGKEKNIASLDALSDEITRNLSIYKNNVNYQSYKNSIDISDPDEFLEKLKEDFSNELKSILEKKTEKIKKIAETLKGSSFDSFAKSVTELPRVGFNIIDKMILKNIRYCPTDNCIYIMRNKKLKLIGTLSEVMKDPTVNGLCDDIKISIGNSWNEFKPMGIDEYVGRCISSINAIKKDLTDKIRECKDNGEEWNDISITAYKDDQENGENIFTPSKYCSDEYINAIDMATDAFVLEKFYNIVPGSLFMAKIIELKAKYTTYEYGDPAHPNKAVIFNNFFYNVVKSGETLSEIVYLRNIFNNYRAEIKDLPEFRLEEAPRNYADTDVPALFRYDENVFKENVCKDFYRRFEDCDNLTLFKSWMNEDEFKFAMAWAYAAVHPTSTNSNIALLLWTGGGTGKSSFVAMIKRAIEMATNAKDPEIYFEIKGTKFDEDQKNWIPEGQIGLPKAALVNIDEATTKSIEIYKDFSGSAAGNVIATRQMYEKAMVNRIYGKFIFTTNKGLQLTSDDGSLLRRVAIIKHNDVNNKIGNKNIKTNDEILKEYDRQIPMLMTIGKKCYHEIINAGYSSIDEYAMTVENINKNLKESTSVNVNIRIYAEIWNRMEVYWQQHKQHDGTYRVRGKMLKWLYTKSCDELGEDIGFFRAFKNFIIDNKQYFVNSNEQKHVRNWMTLDDANNVEFHTEDCGSIYCLNKLKESEEKEN